MVILTNLTANFMTANGPHLLSSNPISLKCTLILSEASKCTFFKTFPNQHSVCIPNFRLSLPYAFQGFLDFIIITIPNDLCKSVKIITATRNYCHSSHFLRLYIFCCFSYSYTSLFSFKCTTEIWDLITARGRNFYLSHQCKILPSRP